MLDAYRAGKHRPAVPRAQRFVNTMKQTADDRALLPVEAIAKEALQTHWDYIYEPDARAVLDEVLMRYIEAPVYQAVAENMASEHRRAWWR